MSRVLLTGASGFIGRQTIAPLLGAGHEVHAVSRAAFERDGVVWHGVDLLTAPEVVARVRPQLLVHLAWIATPGVFWNSEENLRWVEASLGLLRAFATVGGERAVIAGSCAEYEWSRAVFSEDAPTRPATLYGAAKHGLHVTAEAFAEQAGFALAWGRLFFLYGPHEAPERFVPSLANDLLAGRSAPMTDGSQIRDLMHVADAGSAVVALLESQVTGSVNVASGIGVSLREVAEQVARAADTGARPVFGAMPRRPDDPPRLVADVRRLRDEVGFTPSFGLERRIAETVEWWRSRRG